MHLGGTFEEIAASERTIRDGGIAERPFVLLVQPSLFDPARAPAGKHTAWAYCHVPNGSRVNVLEHIEMQIERYAPGFAGTVLARRTFDRTQPSAQAPGYPEGAHGSAARDVERTS